MKNRGKRTLAIWALVIALCSITVAYAALQTTLSISGTVTKKGGTWDIQFTDVAWVSGVALTKTPSTSGTNLNFSVTLSKPGDYTIIKFKVTNNGSLPAYLNDVQLSVGSDTTTLTTSNEDGHQWNSAPESKSVVCLVSSDSTAPYITEYGGNYYNDNFLWIDRYISANGDSTDYLYLKCLYDLNKLNDAEELSTDATVNVSFSLFYAQANMMGE